MKNYKNLVFLITICVLSSCVNETKDNTDDNPHTAKVQFNIKEYEQKPFSNNTRGELSKSCSHLTFIDCIDGQEIQRIDQSSSETEFGFITANLELGTHELFFIGHNQTNLDFNINNFDLSFPKIGDT